MKAEPGFLCLQESSLMKVTKQSILTVKFKCVYIYNIKYNVLYMFLNIHTYFRTRLNKPKPDHFETGKESESTSLQLLSSLILLHYTQPQIIHFCHSYSDSGLVAHLH